MNISDNILSAFFAGTSTIDEDRQIIDSMAADDELADIMDIISEIDSMDEINEMRKEFNERLDFNENYSDYKLKIK